MYNINPDGCFALAIPNTGITALNLNQEINLFGSCTKIYTTEVVTYPVIQDEPTHLEKDYGWKKNLKVGIAATVGLAILAGIAVATVGIGLAAIALAGATVGTAAVTVGATYSDIKSGNSRSLGEFAGQLTMGATIGFTTGASIYGLVTAIPAASVAIGVETSLLTGSTSTLTAVTIPNLVTAGGYAVAGGMGAVAVNESFAVGSGTNVLVETVFDGDVQAYETTTMCIEMLGMMYVQCGMDNAALGMDESKDKGGRKGVYLEGESGSKANFDNEIPRSGADWNEYLKGKYGADNVHWNINSVDDIFSDPTRLKGYTADELQTILGNDWTRGVYGSNGGGWKLMNGDISIFYHPGGGKHGGSYYGISSGATGKIKVVNPETYIPLKGDKATVIYD